MEDLGQSQSSGFSDSRMRSDRFAESRNETSSPQRSSAYQTKRTAPEEELKNYISEQDMFLKKLDDDRKRLNEKLRGPSNQNQNQNQAIQKVSEKPEKSERPKTSLPKSSHEEDEAIEELQKKAEDLLSRFMQPSKGMNDSDSEEEKNNERSLFKSKAFEVSRSDKNQSYLNSRSKPTQHDEEEEEEEEENYTPAKSNKFRQRRGSDSSASELDYSMSERDRVFSSLI